MFVVYLWKNASVIKHFHEENSSENYSILVLNGAHTFHIANNSVEKDKGPKAQVRKHQPNVAAQHNVCISDTVNFILFIDTKWNRPQLLFGRVNVSLLFFSEYLASIIQLKYLF